MSDFALYVFDIREEPWIMKSNSKLIQILVFNLPYFNLPNAWFKDNLGFFIKYLLELL